MKKLLMILVALTLLITPFGLNYDHADAKGYKSGKKSFNSTTTPTKPDSMINSSTTKSNGTATKSPATTAPTAPSKGGLMKGLLMGGLAGLLFGSLFSHLGILGSMLGFMINLLAIVAIIVLIRKAFLFFKNQRPKQGMDAWKR